jgi:DNA gyrase subunit A
VVDGAVVITVSDLGTVKSTDLAEIPSKGRGTGGVRVTKFKDEHRLDFAWIGNPERIVAIVGQPDAPTKPDNTPDPVAIRPTRRDGPATTSARRILAIGTLRW